jgi:malonate-semialdehyde dehydrogenase (acetylating)/methylmalonate-semialdehyde dehydrogenase
MTSLDVYLLLNLDSTCSGPVISPQAKKRICELIASCEQEGGKIVLDGRDLVVPEYHSGNFVGPTIIETRTDMKCYQCVLHFLDFILI